MIFILIPLSLIPLVIIILLAFSKKSDPLVRKSAIAALILIAVSVIVCGVILANAHSGESSGIAIPVIMEGFKAKPIDLKLVIFFVAFLAGLTGLLLFLYSREKKVKKRKKVVKFDY